MRPLFPKNLHSLSRHTYLSSICFCYIFLFCTAATFAQQPQSAPQPLNIPTAITPLFVPTAQPIGIGTTTPNSMAALDITSTNKGVLFPRLTASQQSTLASMLTAAETGMVVTDAATGNLIYWGGSGWQHFTATQPLTALPPLSVTSNSVSINAGTAAGDLLTWDGTNWVNAQPAVQHWSFQQENHQPYNTINFNIAEFGIFPTQTDASEPYVGEIYMLGCNFAINGFALCDGSLVSIAQYVVLYQLIGTTYGGDGISTFALPDLRGRVPMHMGSNGTSNYTIGQTGGTEQKTFSH